MQADVTFRIARDDNGLWSITCFICGLTSWNPNDVRYRYCGHCHRFHDDPGAGFTEACGCLPPN
jgi:hypothetical protein